VLRRAGRRVTAAPAERWGGRAASRSGAPGSRQEIACLLVRGAAAAQTLYAQYDALQEVRRRAEKQLVAEAGKHAIASVLQTCPGLGPIRVAQLLPIVVTPQRFRTKRQFWSYCGLGIVMRSSADWVRDRAGTWQRAPVAKTRGLSVAQNRQLKAIFKGTATTVIAQHPDDPLGADYYRCAAPPCRRRRYGVRFRLSSSLLCCLMASASCFLAKASKRLASVASPREAATRAAA